MPKFSYVAKDKDARVITGMLDARDTSFVVGELRKKSLTIISITEEKEERKFVALKGRIKVKSMDLVIFSRQLATLIDSGVSLVVGLNILSQQVENAYLKKIVCNVKSDIEAGNSLSTSFAKYPSAFPAIFMNMVKAGESGGNLNEILERVADHLERTEKLMGKIKSSLAYPIIIVVMAVAVIAFMMLKVVPAFKNIFMGLGSDLPWPTELLINASNISARFFPFVVILSIASYMIFAWYIRTEKGRLAFDSFKLALPIIGPIVNKVSVSRFTRTLATLVKSGVSILEAFDVAGKVAENKVIEIATEQIKISLQSGENIAEPMERSGKFSPFVSKMISVGEQTGELEKMLSKISDYYETQVNESLTSLTSMIEPVVIAFLGISIGFIVVAMFLPIFRLTQIIAK